MDFTSIPFPDFPPSAVAAGSAPSAPATPPSVDLPSIPPPAALAAEVKACCERYFESVARTEELLTSLDAEKAVRSNLVKHLREELGVMDDLEIGGTVYTSRRKGDTWFLCRVTRKVQAVS